MSDDEGFLARWSRRKRGAAQRAGDRPEPETAGPSPAPRGPSAAPLPEEAPLPFDPAGLPPIESIGAASDIQPFLAAGVPAEVTRAALRRAWAVDPAIRDFIGLSENSWDFNAPGSMAGFGELTAEEVRRLLSQAMPEPDASGARNPAPHVAAPAHTAAHAQDSGSVAPDQAGIEQINDNNAAAQHDGEGRECSPAVPRRSHGGALPK